MDDMSSEEKKKLLLTINQLNVQAQIDELAADAKSDIESTSMAMLSTDPPGAYSNHRNDPKSEKEAIVLPTFARSMLEDMCAGKVQAQQMPTLIKKTLTDIINDELYACGFTDLFGFVVQMSTYACKHDSRGMKRVLLDKV